MGLQWAHAELVSQCEGLLIGGFSMLMRRGFAPQSRPGDARPTPGGHVPGAPARASAYPLPGHAPPPGDLQADTPHPGGDDRASDRLQFPGPWSAHGLCEQRQGVGDTSSEVVCRTKATAISVRRRVVIRCQGIVKVTSLLAQLPSYVPYSPHGPRTHRRFPAPAYRQVMAQRFQMWRQVTGAAAA
jgi:hypothetical protein